MVRVLDKCDNKQEIHETRIHIAHIPHFGGRVGVNRRIPPHLAVEVRWDLKQA